MPYHNQGNIPEIEAIFPFNMTSDMIQGVVVNAASFGIESRGGYSNHVVAQVPFLACNKCLRANSILHSHVLLKHYHLVCPVRHQSYSQFLDVMK